RPDRQRILHAARHQEQYGLRQVPNRNVDSPAHLAGNTVVLLSFSRCHARLVMAGRHQHRGFRVVQGAGRMKIRKEILDIYKAVHTWTGIIAGLALFVAFYAGALTVFKHDLAAWVAAPMQDTRSVDPQDAGQLIKQTLHARPDAAHDFTLNLRATDAEPAQLSWKTEDGTRQYHAAFDASGKLLISEREPTAVAELVDNLHRTAGFVPGDVEVGILVIGFIAMMYGLALVSGLIILLPSLAKDLFALRLGKNLKLMWKDAHNAIGFFSLPFHLIIALTTVVFAFHDQIYDTQDVFIYEGRMMDQWRLPPPTVRAPSLATEGEATPNIEAGDASI